MGKRYYARRRSLQKIGNSIGVTLPKDELRELPEDAEARAYIDEDEGVLGVEVDLE